MRLDGLSGASFVWSFISWTVPLCGKEVPMNKLSPLCLIGSQSFCQQIWQQ